MPNHTLQGTKKRERRRNGTSQVPLNQTWLFILPSHAHIDTKKTLKGQKNERSSSFNKTRKRNQQNVLIQILCFHFLTLSTTVLIQNDSFIHIPHLAKLSNFLTSNSNQHHSLKERMNRRTNTKLIQYYYI